ncbi:MAG: hypothetical protein ACM3SR_15635 [Ignavibacteriales bacterium]
MLFRIDIFEEKVLIRQEYFDNLQEAEKYQSLWNGYQRIPGVPWRVVLITENVDAVQHSTPKHR